MSSQMKVTTVRSVSVGQPGRALNTARMHGFVLDSSTGPGEDLTNTEAFLAGIASCGVTLIEKHAKDAGIPLAGLEVTIAGVQGPPDPAKFQHIDMHFTLRAARADADRLVEVWRQR